MKRPSMRTMMIATGMTLKVDPLKAPKRPAMFADAAPEPPKTMSRQERRAEAKRRWKALTKS